MTSNSHVCMYTLSHPILCDYSHQLLCTWDFPGKDTEVDCHFFPQRIFPIQGLNPCLLHLLHWQTGSLPLAPSGKPLLLSYLFDICCFCYSKNIWLSFPKKRVTSQNFSVFQIFCLLSVNCLIEMFSC